MISVCMATFNGEKYLYEQICSILPQLDRGDEIVIVDDLSTDTTVEILKSIRDERIRLYFNQINLGPIRSFERALKLCSGDIIFLADQDDIWLPDKVKIFVDEFNKDATCIISDAYVMINDVLIVDTFFQIRGFRETIIGNLYKNSYIGCCMAFKKEILEKALPFPEKISMHDMWLGLLSSYYKDVKFINKPLIIYRRHESNATPLQSKNSWKMITSRVSNICAFLSRLQEK